jgi:hypothetical protein
MKEQPYTFPKPKLTTAQLHKSTKPARPKSPYSVTIEESTYNTFAYNPEGALSNAAYRYADQEDMEVKQVMWKIKHEELYSKVEEL